MRFKHGTIKIGVSAVAITLPVLVALTPQTASANVPTLVAGTVAMDGHPVSHGTVSVSIWPSQASLEKTARQVRSTHKRQPVPLVRLPAVSVSSTGHFRVAFNPSSLPASMVGPSGQIDIQMKASDGTRRTFWTTSLLPSKDGYVSTAQRPSENARAVRLELGTNKNLLAQAASQASAAGAISTSSDAPAEDCSTEDLGRRGPAEATWLYVSASPYTRGAFNYKVGTSHRLAVGVSTSFDKYGSFHIEGSNTRTSNFSAASDFKLRDVRITAKWWYEEYYESCLGGGYAYTLKPLSMYHLPYYYYGNHLWLPYCYKFEPYVTYTTDKGLNRNYTTGVNVGGAFGESQSGRSTYNLLGMRSYSKAGSVCGTSSYSLYASDLWEGSIW